MRFQMFSQWGGATAVNTEPRARGEEYVGIAIGPQSDEHQVMCDGVLLQAGRMLPIKARTYALQKLRPLPPLVDVAGNLAYACISKLQVVLFETYDEMASYKTPQRPPLQYSSPRLQANLTSFTTIFAFPFGGRTGATIQFCSDDEGANTFQLELLGVRFNQANAMLSSGSSTVDPPYTTVGVASTGATAIANGQFVYTILLGPTGAGTPLGSAPTVFGSPPGAWDAIVIGAAGLVAGMHLQIDATVYGEL